MCDSEDVLTRLDTLLTSCDSGPNSVNSSTSSNSSTPSSILKTPDKESKKKSLRFREEKELQEVIGYGGEDNLDCSSSSEEDEESSHKVGETSLTSKSKEEQQPEELTVEEKNVLNLTRQNTTFNTHAQNLNTETSNGPPPLLRLGVDKKVTPIITVRPFGMRTNDKINKVQPMIKGELVSEAKTLNSDGVSSSESSSDQDSDSSSAQSREYQRAKNTAATARLSFLSSTIAFEAKGEPTTDIVSNWVKTPEDEDEIDVETKTNNNKNIRKPSVKLTRKSPYVTGHTAAILKGTPKPSINVRNKPPIPAKPEKLLSLSCNSSSSSGSVSPIAAPRRNHFAGSNEVTISESHIDLTSTESDDADSDNSGIAECYTVNADVKNNLILDVSIGSDAAVDKVKQTPKVPKVQAKFNQMALEAIRQSLTNKISVQEELSDKNEDEVEKFISKSNFETNRANVANALGFTRRPSTKTKKAPEPPHETAEKPSGFNQIRNAIEEAKSGIKSLENTGNGSDDVTDNGTPSEKPVVQNDTTEAVSMVPIVAPPKVQSNGATVLQNDTTTVVANGSSSTKIPTAPPLPNNNTPEIKSSIKSSIKNPSSQESSQSSVVKSVQFSPETTSITLEPEIQTISYNRWISRDPLGKVIESSFTGQPIAVQSPVQRPSMHNKKVVQQNHPIGAETDEIRKWTEKKKGSRSKSLPRGGSEIDEILGSSKTKPQTRLFPVVLTPAPKPVHRQSRVELYENDRKRMRQSTKFSSIKKLFKLGSNPNLSEINQRRNSISSSSPMDKEHEREILERERSKLRPEIIHPLDLQSGGVEVVKITPKSNASSNGSSTKKSILANLKKEDSGHETSSIHSDSNEASTSSNSSEAGGQSTEVLSHAMPPTLKNKLYAVGRAKPVPPPRSHSLEQSKIGNISSSSEEDGSDISTNPSTTAKNENLIAGEEPNESLPPSGYVVAGKMRLGSSISVPAPNSAHLRREAQQQQQQQQPSAKKLLTPFRTESINSSIADSNASSSLFQAESSNSERESISPSRINDSDQNGDESSKRRGSSSSTNLLGSRLSNCVRNGRSVVHKNLEDNYGAVISANHEALAQILEQQTSHSQNRGEMAKVLKGVEKVSGRDFSLVDEAGHVPSRVGSFYSATYGPQKIPLTLLLRSSSDETPLWSSRSAFSLCPVTKFTDNDGGLISKAGGIVYVFGRLQVETLETYTKKLITSNMNWEREISFILLQLINGLKTLQAQGIEEIPATMDHFLLTRVDKDPQYRVVNILDGSSYENEPKMTLCNAALASMLTLFQLKNPVSELGQDLPELTPSVGMFRSMCSILRQGSSISNLEQVKSMLEYMLWGPSDIAFEVSSHQETREESLQRWLDLERATVLHNLIRSQGLRIQLTVFEEYHLLFLVQTCAKMLQEASLLFESEVACM